MQPCVEPVRIMTAEQIRRAFSGFGKRVLSFAGFGELGYEDPRVVTAVAREVLGGLDPRGVLVNSGTLMRSGGEDGIAAIYPIAKSLGFATAGIHPSVALDFRDTHPVSAHCDYVHFIRDETWGGFLEGSRELSPTLRVVMDVTDELIVIGGGKHAAQELEAFARHGKKVRYFPAEMNRRTTREWCSRSGAGIEDYKGAAHAAWLALGGATSSSGS